MAAKGSFKVGNAYILITPEMNQAALREQLSIAEREIAAFAGDQKKLAQQTARLQAKLQEYVTKVYGAEAARRVGIEQAAAAKRAEFNKSETAAYLKALTAITEAYAKAETRKTATVEKQAALRDKVSRTSRDLEIKHGKAVANSFLSSVAEMEAAGKRLTAGRIASARQWATLEIAEQRKVAAEHAALVRAREAQIAGLSQLVIRQASIEATEQTKAARTAQAAYTTAFNTRRAQALAELELQRSVQAAAAQTALVQARAAKAAATETIRQNTATVKALQANAAKVDKSWTSAVHGVGTKLDRFGTTMSEFGRSVNRNLVTPLMSAAGAMSYLGIKSADSIIQSQTALQRMGVSNKDSAKQINTLRDYGTETPYSVEDMFRYGTQYARAGTAHGLSSKDASKRATELVQAIGNLSAYAGITDPAQVGRAMYAVSIMQDADRASLRNVKSLADNAGIPVQELAESFGFQNRAYTEKELQEKRDQQDKKGVKIALPKEYTASAQMMDWMANAKTTGGVPGEGIVEAIIKRGEDKKIKGAAVKQGEATISARLSNMWEQAKFGLSDMFISPTGKDGAYQYTGAGEKLMGKGGLLDQISGAGAKLKKPAGELIEAFFTDLELVGGWLHTAVNAIEDHPAIADTVIKVGKWAAAIGVAALAFGALTKTVGLITKLLSPLAGPVKLLVKGLKGGAKIASQLTGVGSKTEADQEARSIRQQGKDRAAGIREDAKGMSRRSRKIRNRYADQVEAEAKQQAKETRRAGRSDTSAFDRYRQRRTSLNGGDDRSVATRAVDRVRGRNSQIEKIQLDTSEAEKRIRDLDEEISGLRTHIRDLRSENLRALAAEFAGQDSSVQAAAGRAQRAVRDAELAITNLRSLKLGALAQEFTRVTSEDDGLRAAVKRAEAAVTDLNARKLGGLGGEVNDSKSRVNVLISAVRSGIKQFNSLDGKKLGDVKGEVNNVKDAADSASKAVGSGRDSLISRIGQLNGLKTGDIVTQIDNLKKKLKDTSDEASTLNSRLDDISSHAPGGSSAGKGGKGKGKTTKKALGGVLPGYTPGQDVHRFESPTGGVLELSGGESVMRPEWTVAMGPDYVARMNLIARQEGVNGVRQAMQFANGGILSKMGLDKLIDASRDFNVYPDALGAFATMSMDSSSRPLGGDAQKGVVGSGTDGSHYVGADLSRRFEGMKDFMSRDSWQLLKKLPIPDGYSQALGIVGGAVGPVAADLFWEDVWKGRGNVLERGNAFLNDLLSFDTVKRITKDFAGGIWDTVKGVVSSGTDFLSDPFTAVKETVSGVWQLVENEYDGLIDMVSTIREIYTSPKDYAGQVWGEVYDTAQESLPNMDGLFDFSGDHLSSKMPDIDKAIDQQISTPGKGSAVTRWTPQVKAALAQLGLSQSYVDLVLHRIQVESGGNPKAINLTDSNAKAGYPSQGLLQTIPSTFEAYAGPYRSRGIYDPMASIYAGLNYAVHRYGSGWVRALSGTKGYASGTAGADRGWAWVGEEGPELVQFSGGETVLSHNDSMLATARVFKGYATGTGTRTSGVAADAEKGVSSLNSAVKKLYEIITKAFTSGRIGSGTANSLNKWLDKENKQLQSLVKQRADLAPKLKDANAKLAAVKKDESEMAASIADKAKGLRSLTDVFNSGGVSASAGLANLKERLAAIKSFQSDIAALVKKGFSKDIISEVAQAGPEQGDAMAKELLKSTAAQVTDYNKTYADIGSASDSLGTSVASSYYAAGKKSAQALVDGLTSKDKTLVKKIEGMADTIVKTLKKRLKVSAKTPVDSGLAALLTWLTGEGQAVKGGGNTQQKKTTRVTTSYSTDSKGRKVTTVTTTVYDPAKGTTTTTTERTVGGKTTKSTKTTRTKGYATGTRSAAPGIALVGEKGPELIRFNGGERVDDARKTAQLMGPRYEIHIHEAKSEDTAQAVLRAMRYAEVMAGM